MLYRSYAKINIYLDVLEPRRDGYTNIETIFQSVGLWDELRFEPRPAGFELTCSDATLPCDASNLVWRAADLLRHATGCAKGAAIHLDKHIPMAAGLAGGSGNAAAALIGLNTLWDLGLSVRTLQTCARKLGADVAYCLRGGTVAATLRGDTMATLPPLPETWFVLLHPPLALSTPAVYKHPLLARSKETPYAGRTRAFRAAITALQRDSLAAAVFNRMESAAFAMHPQLDFLKQRLLEAGCTAAAMSGSGPTVFGLCENRAQADQVAGEFTDVRASVVATVPYGVEAR
ncbi:MAG: 4-(cytidine 5'-diphospho)-2-C-methyl-D-erythritol kinase [Candidatus Hydrogenedentes bacterium]|nr:4-(cytidine 5'-diphospho)-2-C-methyl-D-erythritol kinase [Candidatus Hydrogenedentota bacterium]